MALWRNAASPGLSNAWDRASPRERLLLALAGIVVALGAGWAWIWQPLQSDVARLSRDLPLARQVLAAARAQADDLVALQRTPGAARSGDPRAAVERALAEHSLRPAVTSLDVQEGRVRLTFAEVRFDALPAIIETLGRADGLRVLEADVTARVEPGTVRAELTFVR
jgi:type II secretory pathway component PulM